MKIPYTKQNYNDPVVDLNELNKYFCGDSGTTISADQIEVIDFHTNNSKHKNKAYTFEPVTAEELSIGFFTTIF